MAGRALTRLYQSIKDVALIIGGELDQHWMDQFNSAMNDDFNTPVALSVLFQLSHEINKTKSPSLAATLKHLAGTLGILQEFPDSFLQSGLAVEGIDNINQLVEERFQARLRKEWARADEIRKMLLEQGVEVEDGAEGTTWRMVTKS